MSLSAGRSLLVSVKEAIRMMAVKAGIKLVAAAADIDITALKSSIHLLAKLDITLTSNRISIGAKEEVEVIGGGSFTRWNAVGITDLVIDIDGQGQRYIHGPVQTFSVNWPGARGGAMAEIVANPRLSSAASTLAVSGPWALFRLMDKGRILTTATSGRVGVEFTFDGRRAVLDISAGSQANPLNSDVLKSFHCPGAAA
jgi:hypothetical protein